MVKPVQDVLKILERISRLEKNQPEIGYWERRDLGYNKNKLSKPYKFGTKKYDTPRTETKPIRFTTPFSSRPHVLAGFTLLDIGNLKDNTRIEVASSNVTESGFDLCVTTWRGTIIYGYRAFWIALPEDGVVLNTNDDA